MNNDTTQNSDTLKVATDNRFAIIPHWVIFSGITAGALKLYAVLTKYADYKTGTAYPSRATLAKDVGKSVRTIDAYTKELVGVGALHVQERKKKGTKQNYTNLYTILTANPVQPTARGGVVDCAENDTHLPTPSLTSYALTAEVSEETPSTPVVETTTDNTTASQLGLTKGEVTYLVSRALETLKQTNESDSFSFWEDYADEVETVTGVMVGDLILNRGFDDRLEALLRKHEDKGERYVASAWLATLINTARSSPW